MSQAAARIADALLDLEPSAAEFRQAVEDGLSAWPKSLPCKFFYDQAGSDLFELICELPEYYPTRTETGILSERAGEIADLLGSDVRLVEFGSGAGIKVRILLGALEAPAAYLPVDISRPHLIAASESLSADFPDLVITPVCADYTQAFDLPPTLGRTAGFFPGSTIGNFTPLQAEGFLAMVRSLLGRSGVLIIGVDLKKDPAILNAAYDDRAGVTARFNLNLLARINRELGGNFRLDRFAHRAFYNEAEGRIEMHLVSLDEAHVRIGGRVFSFAAGEAVHTENSYKYDIEEFRALARTAGFEPVAVWTDPDRLFSVHALRVG